MIFSGFGLTKILPNFISIVFNKKSGSINNILRGT